MLTKGKERFSVAQSSIAVGEQADMTLFSPEGITTVNKESIKSSVKNSAYFGREMKGTYQNCHPAAELLAQLIPSLLRTGQMKGLIAMENRPLGETS